MGSGFEVESRGGVGMAGEQVFFSSSSWLSRCELLCSTTPSPWWTGQVYLQLMVVEGEDANFLFSAKVTINCAPAKKNVLPPTLMQTTRIKLNGTNTHTIHEIRRGNCWKKRGFSERTKETIWSPDVNVHTLRVATFSSDSLPSHSTATWCHTCSWKLTVLWHHFFHSIGSP